MIGMALSFAAGAIVGTSILSIVSIAMCHNLKPETRKPKDVSDDGIERYICSCGNLMYGKKKYCEKCGSRLFNDDELQHF